GSYFNTLFQKPGYFGEMFYDRKSTYSMNCQLIVMLHNLHIVDYGLGHPGSVHDVYAFLGTRTAQNPDMMIPPEHWIWADSVYVTQMWCVVPFKSTGGTGLSQSRNIYNKYLSKHAFAALKGQFQSLHELRLNMKIAMHWIQCCMIIHNMIIDFEDALGVERTMGWARREGAEPRHCQTK
ncbi:hypothetical protein OG21DRAFT_1417053, partial [Imleria badia]